MSLHDLAECEMPRDTAYRAVSQPGVLLTEPLWSRPRDTGRPLKCLTPSDGRMEKRVERKEWVGGGRGVRRERCYHFHLLLRVGVKGVTENR